MDVTSIPKIRGAWHRKKRVGRGIGSGHGKTSTRGQKGQRARTGEGKRPGFEGGRNPLIRRVPKRGFRQKARGRPVPSQIVNLDQLNIFADGQRIAAQQLAAAGIIARADRPVKLLGDGQLTKKVTLIVNRSSESAKAKLAKAGGTLELVNASG